MRKIGIRYYDTNLTEESFREMRDGGMTATEIDLVVEPEKLDFRSRPLTVRDFYNNALEIFAGNTPSRI